MTNNPDFLQLNVVLSISPNDGKQFSAFNPLPFTVITWAQVALAHHQTFEDIAERSGVDGKLASWLALVLSVTSLSPGDRRSERDVVGGLHGRPFSSLLPLAD